MDESSEEQSRLIDEDPDPVFINYKEIQSEELQERTLTQEEEILSFQEVVRGLSRQTGSHKLSNLDEIGDNPKMFVKKLLEEYPDHQDVFCSSLVNNFSDSMKTRAREEGKYVILIIMPNSVLVCHTDAEKSITKDMNIIERLLDTDNVDKYVRFTDEDEEILVEHFERHKSKSLSEWLGISSQDISYEDAGDIRIYTIIDESTCVFEYSRAEFEEKFLLNESFELVGDILRTSNDNEYPVEQIKLGRRKFDTIDEFLQEFYSLYYDLKACRSQYDNIANSIEPWETKVIDNREKVTEGVEGETIVLKENEDLDILFANNKIELSASWRLDLVQKFNEGTQTRLYHAGRGFSEEPLEVGSFKIYNKTEIKNIDRLNDIYDIAQKADTGGQLSNILYYVVFRTLRKWSDKPLSYFFRQLSEKYKEDLISEGIVLQDENDILEFKARDWLTDGSGEIAQKITEEIQGDTRLVIVGIDEEEQQIRPVSRNRFDSERNERIQDEVKQSNDNHESVNIFSLPISDGDCLIIIFAIQDSEDIPMIF